MTACVIALVTSSCLWPMSNFGPARNGVNPFERTIGVTNVGGLEEQWKAPDAQAPPVVDNTTLFTGTSSFPFKLQAFDSAGMTNCSSTSTTCTPLWTAPTVGSVDDIAVFDDVVYAVDHSDRLFAFDAHGVNGCGGTPKTCTPLFFVAGARNEPVVVGDVLFVTGTDGRLKALDASGATNCTGTPKKCSPLWRTPRGGHVSSANGKLYVATVVPSGAAVEVYDAAGKERCGGSPKICQPLFTAITNDFDIITRPAPAVIANGLLFAGVESGDERSIGGQLYVFDADGGTNCAARSCQPLWTIDTDGVTVAPVVNGSTLYVVDRFFSDPDLFALTQRNGVHAYDINTCAAQGGACAPLWSADGAAGNAAFANGVLYVGAGTNLNAFDGAGNTGCPGTPKVCTPLWTATIPTGFVTEPIVAQGKVFVVAGDAVHAYGV